MKSIFNMILGLSAAGTSSQVIARHRGHDGRIVYAFADTDYTRRAEPADLFKALDSIQK